MCLDWGPVAKHLLQLSLDERWQGQGRRAQGQSSEAKPYNRVYLWMREVWCVGGVGGVKVIRLEGECLAPASGWTKPEMSSSKSGMFALPLTHSAFIFRALRVGCFEGVWKRPFAQMAPYAVTKTDCFSVTKWIPGLPSHRFSKSSHMFRKVGFYVGPLFSFAFPHWRLHGRSRFLNCVSTRCTEWDYFL